MLVCNLLYFLMCILAVFGQFTKMMTKKPGSGLIVRGFAAKPFLFPYQVSLRSVSTDKHFCGGSIISQSWVLTAGHCVNVATIVDIASLFKVVAGTVYLYNNDGSTHLVSSAIIHPSFNATTMVNDIAVVKVKVPFTYSRSIQTISLASIVPPSGTFTTLTGWGVTSDDATTSPNQLQALDDIAITPTSSCLEYYEVGSSEEVGNKVICTGNSLGQGSCFGDSGGPLAYNGSQIGIASFGSKPCASGRPDAYANVPFFNAWISTTIGLKC